VARTRAVFPELIGYDAQHSNPSQRQRSEAARPPRTY
jgi:hypothetical protein